MRKNINYSKRFGKYLESVRFLIVILIIFSSALALLSLVFPFIWANIVGNLVFATADSNYLSFIKIILIYIVLELIEGILNLIKNFVYTQMETKVSRNLKRDLFNKVLSLETKAFDKNRVSYFTTKIMEDPHTLVAGYYKVIGMFITAFKLLVLIVCSYKLCFDIGIIFTVASVIIYLSISKIKPFIAKNMRTLNSNVREYSSSVFDDIRNIREIKSLGAKEIVRNNFEEVSNSLESKITSSKNVDNLFELLMFTIKFSIHSLVLIITTYYYFADTLAFENIIVLELFAAILFTTTRKFAELNSVVMMYKNALKSIFDVLTNKNYASEKYGNLEDTKGDGDLIVKNVSFALGNRKMLLDDINFEIRRNSKVAIVDKGGNSKQILLKLLLRQYEPTEGRIMIDDVNIKDFTEQALRRNVMLVSEKPFILNDTLENNIKVVKPNASIEEVVDVCKKTGILKWFEDETLGEIMSMQVGEGGLELTDSRKQLIAIARVLLAMPKIVIIEEAQNDISSDDTFSIKNALDQITNSTVLIFSERISSISVCDEIITLATSKYGASIVSKDVIRERSNFYGISERDRRINNEEKIENLIDSNGNKKYDDNQLVDTNDIKKLNMQKGAKRNEEHRIFSQIW